MARVKEFDENEILDKALTLFWHKGYNGTSAQELVDGLGISRSSLYGTFTDKRTLFLKALQRYQENNTEQLVKLSNESEDAVGSIKLIFQNLSKESQTDQLSKGCFMVNSAIDMAPHDKEIAAIVDKNMQDAEDAFFRIIKKGQRSGQLSSTIDARAIARFLFNNVAGLRVAARMKKEKKIMDDIIKTALSVL